MLLLLLSLMVTLLSSLLLTIGARRRRRSKLPPLPPGPKGWPLLGNLLQLGANPHETLHTLSKTHGPLLHLRFGSVHVIVANSAAVAAQILRHDANFSDRPSSSATKHMAYNHQDLIFAHHGPRWLMLRKLCAQRLFSSKAMDDLRPVRADEVARLVRELAERGTSSASVVDLGSEISKCAANVLSRMVVGRRLFGDGDEGGKEFRDMVEELMNLAGAFNIGDFIPCLAWLDLQGLVEKTKKLHRRFDGFLNRIIAEHRAETASDGSGDGRCDFLSVLVKAKEGGRKGEHIMLTDADIKPLLQNMFAAGTDTTTNTVEMAMAELIRNPALLARAQHELDSVVGRGRLVSEDDLSNLPFLHAVVKETFRHHPAAPLSLPRSATADGEIDGYLIPNGATLLINIWAIARDPAAWPHDDDPMAFRPDRFLAGGRHHGLDVKGGDFGLIPFGAGRRICAGMNLGLRMVHFMTAALVHAFEWELPDGELAAEIDMGSSFGLTLHRTHPLMVRPVQRLLPEAYLPS